MQPLITLFHSIHSALGGEMDKLEAHARSINPDRPEEAAAFAGHFSMINGLLETHAGEEERVLWPAIEKRSPGALASFQVDHDTERVVMGRIKTSVEALQASAANGAEVAAALVRDAVVAAELLKLHMHKEEVTVYAPFADQVGEAEQMRISGQILSNLPAEILPQAMPWLASFHTAEEVAEVFGLYVRCVDDERGRQFITALSLGLPQDKWQEVSKLAPQLAAYAA